MSKRPFKRFVGVDLGGGKGKKTAVATLELTDGGISVVELLPRSKSPPLYDSALINRLRAEGEDSVLCVDAPLTLPACLRCQVSVCPGQEQCEDDTVIEMRRLFGAPEEPGRDFRRGKPPVTPYTQRVTEVYLHQRRGVLPRETLGQGMGPLTARAAHLLRALADRFRLNDNLIEVYPKATLQLLGFREPYKKRVDRRIEILAMMPDLSFGPGVWREKCRQSDHAFDAVMCAYTGYLWSRDGWQLPSDVRASMLGDGWIWVPPEPANAQAQTPESEPATPLRKIAGN